MSEATTETTQVQPGDMARRIGPDDPKYGQKFRVVGTLSRAATLAGTDTPSPHGRLTILAEGGGWLDEREVEIVSMSAHRLPAVEPRPVAPADPHDPLGAFVETALLALSDEESAAMTGRLVALAQRVRDEGPVPWGTHVNRVAACLGQVDRVREQAQSDEAERKAFRRNSDVGIDTPAGQQETRKREIRQASEASERAWQHLEQGRCAESEDAGRVHLVESVRLAARLFTSEPDAALRRQHGVVGRVLRSVRSMVEAPRSAAAWVLRGAPAVLATGAANHALLAANDRWEWTRLYRVRAPKVRAKLRWKYFPGTPAEAEDVTQDVFLELFLQSQPPKSLDPARPVEAMLGWLVKTCARDAIRAMKPTDEDGRAYGKKKPKRDVPWLLKSSKIKVVGERKAYGETHGTFVWILEDAPAHRPSDPQIVSWEDYAAELQAVSPGTYLHCFAPEYWHQDRTREDDLIARPKKTTAGRVVPSFRFEEAVHERRGSSPLERQADHGAERWAELATDLGSHKYREFLHDLLTSLDEAELAHKYRVAVSTIRTWTKACRGYIHHLLSPTHFIRHAARLAA